MGRGQPGVQWRNPLIEHGILGAVSERTRQGDRPAVQGKGAGRNLQQGGLPGPVLPDDGRELPRRDGEIGTAQDGPPSVGLVHVMGPKYGRGRCFGGHTKFPGTVRPHPPGPGGDAVSPPAYTPSISAPGGPCRRRTTDRCRGRPRAGRGAGRRRGHWRAERPHTRPRPAPGVATPAATSPAGAARLSSNNRWRSFLPASEPPSSNRGRYPGRGDPLGRCRPNTSLRSPEAAGSTSRARALPGRLSRHPLEHIEDVLVDLLPQPVLGPEVMHDEPRGPPRPRRSAAR